MVYLILEVDTMQVIDLQKKVNNLQSTELSQRRIGSGQQSCMCMDIMSCQAAPLHDIWHATFGHCAKQHELCMTEIPWQAVRGYYAREQQWLTRCPISTLYASLRLPGLYLTAFCCQSEGSLQGCFCVNACSCKQQSSVYKYVRNFLVCCTLSQGRTALPG